MTEQNTMDISRDAPEAVNSAPEAPATQGLATAAILSVTAAAALSACGGGGGDGASDLASGAAGRAQAMATTFTQTWPTWGTPTYDQAWRFLQQASMGPTEAEVSTVVANGFDAWLNAQFALPVSPDGANTPNCNYTSCYSVHSGTTEPYYFDTSAYGIAQGALDVPVRPYGSIQRSGWMRFVSFASWYKPYFNTDQLRLRVAHALSQFLVVSLQNADLEFRPQYVTYFMDMLAENAFGNYRTLIENVAKSPAMAIYLSHLANRPPDFSGTIVDPTNPPAIVRIPDQNFARELIQLFTIGLTKLNMDGSQVLVNGQPVMSTKREDVIVLSNVFTGWNYDNSTALATPFLQYQYTANPTSASNAYTTTQMDDLELFDFDINGVKVNNWWSWPHHRSKRLKTLKGYSQFTPWTQAPGGSKVNGAVMNVHSTQLQVAAQLGVATTSVKFLDQPFTMDTTPAASMGKALDLIFAHQNLAPFVAKQMIQHLVTSNPSKAYVQRVATAFKSANWDMKILIKAILLDNEARLQSQANATTYGRLREPFLRVMSMFRAIGIGPNGLFVAETNHVADPALALNLNNAPMRAPTVFNDFSPNYVAVGGAMAAQGKVTPQMQIATETATVAYANAVYEIIANGLGQDPTNSGQSGLLNIDALVTASTTVAQMVDIINRKLFGNVMSAELKAIVQTAATGSASHVNRFKAALYVAVMSTEFMVQR